MEALSTRGVEPDELEDGWEISSLCGECGSMLEWGGSWANPIIGSYTHYDPTANHKPVLVPVLRNR